MNVNRKKPNLHVNVSKEKNDIELDSRTNKRKLDHEMALLDDAYHLFKDNKDHDDYKREDVTKVTQPKQLPIVIKRPDTPRPLTKRSRSS